MAELTQISEVGSDVHQHVIFFHGLDGELMETWQSSGEPTEIWPNWLVDDLDGVAVWAVGYSAAKSRWRNGTAMHLVDQGTNVFERMLLEPKLQSGELIFVGHSLGGLVIKQVLRQAESQALHRREASDFIKRVRRMAFLGTPHLGASLARWAVLFQFFTKPSLVTYCLARDDANLRGLNAWYRSWSIKHHVENLILMESKPSKLVGPLSAVIVPPGSADPGLSSPAIMVEADHYQICKPQNRESEIYQHVKNLICKNLDGVHRDTLIEEKLDQGIRKLEIFEEATTGGFVDLAQQLPEKTADLVAERIREEGGVVSVFSSELFDAEIEKQLSIIQKSCFFGGMDTLDRANSLMEQIIDGGLSSGSSEVKCRALAWCSRFQALDETPSKSEHSLEKAKLLGAMEEVGVAEAFLLARSGDVSESLAKLMAAPSPLKYSAAFMIVSIHEGAERALKWMEDAGVSLSNFDADGKITYLKALFSTQQWDRALENAQKVEKDECRESPALLNLIAMSHLLGAVPVELRATVLNQVPLLAKSFPLFSDEIAIGLRREATAMFSECSSLAKGLACDDVANLADDYRLWLELRDPETNCQGLLKLERSMSGNVECALRRFPLALQFGVDLDLDKIEEVVDLLTARTGGKSLAAGIARFVLAQQKRDFKEIVQYIEAHRQQLTSCISKEALFLFEIEALAKAGLIDEAETRLGELGSDELDETILENCRNILAISRGEDPLTLCITQYRKSNDLSDLIHLVNLLEGANLFQQLHKFSEELFERTRFITDAERLLNTKIELNRYKEAADFLRRYPEFIPQSKILHMHWAWVLFREGKLSESRLELEKIKETYDDQNVRALEVNLAITSGDWESLLPYIDSEWNNREQRSAEELLQAGQLAKAIQPKRAKDLILVAAKKGNDRPDVLTAAYFAATNMGWEDESGVTDWFQMAAKLSGENGPIKSVSLKHLVGQMEDVRDRNSEIWKTLNDGACPVFMVADQLNRTLTDFYLLPALMNSQEEDLRKRHLIAVFSNVRSELPVQGRKLTIDPTVLLTLGFLGLIDVVIDSFEQVIIPHSTLGWLFSEKQKIAFHQPSKIEEAKEFAQLVAVNKIGVVGIKPIDDTDLALEVGDELALLLQETKINDERQRLVVRPYPVHKVSSFMTEIADLTEYADKICSCSALVKKLRETGVLTSEETQNALNYLGTHEKEWPQSTEILDDAILYLDSLSVTYLQFIGVLGEISSSSLEIYVHQHEIDQIYALQNFESVTSNADGILETVRNHLAKGIKEKKIMVSQISEKRHEGNDHHPTFEIFSSSVQTDAVVVDDRFLNRHKNITLESGEVPVHITLDLLDYFLTKEIITQVQWLSHRTRLRQAGYVFIPFYSEEIDYHLQNAPIASGQLRETAELKAFRENLTQLKMSYLVQLPRDAGWLAETLKQLSISLKSQWMHGVDEAVCIARSEWLLRLIDYRGWSHCFDGNAGLGLARHGAGMQIQMLLSPPEGIDSEVKEHYRRWLDERVIEPIKHNDPATFRWLVESTKAQIRLSVEELEDEVKPI